jgi:hypothetical protein
VWKYQGRKKLLDVGDFFQMIWWESREQSFENFLSDQAVFGVRVPFTNVFQTLTT